MTMRGLERLHFFDGQRLQAVDLALEQAYHIRVRRLLNKGLYSPGVVNGLQVVEVDKRHVTVTSGMALDPRGREIVLLEDTVLSVPSRPATPPLPGWFLVIRYTEEAEPGLMADCRCGSGTTPPARIKEVPRLDWTETWPNQQQCAEGGGQPSDCAVVLALVVLDGACQITKIEPAVRQYAHSAIPGQVHPFALEGEKDVDGLNPKFIHFQIRGGPPDAVLLYLWADAISSLLYTEVGSHRHDIHLNSAPTADETPAIQLGHTHHIGDVLSDTTNVSTSHRHDLLVRQPQLNAITTEVNINQYEGKNVAGDPWLHATDVNHQHNVKAHDTQDSSLKKAAHHHHTLTVSSHSEFAGNTAPSGSTPYQARDGQPAYSYPDHVHIKLDGTDITARILASLGWTELGNGKQNHQLVTSGTGSIDLIQLGLPLAVGPHKLELLVQSGGGKLLYNLYVE
jgi:hypothetical protein